MDTPKLKMRSTSYDVARLAGVSQSAVSRCFQTFSLRFKKNARESYEGLPMN
jgi:predicted transcriptional regulator